MNLPNPYVESQEFRSAEVSPDIYKLPVNSLRPIYLYIFENEMGKCVYVCVCVCFKVLEFIHRTLFMVVYVSLVGL